MKVSISSATKQNRRPYQEDRMSVRKFRNGSLLLGIFDGHGGEWVSEYAAKNLPRLFTSIRKKNPDATLDELMNLLFAKLHERTIHLGCGSTASVVYVPSGHTRAYVAILGDSTVFVGDGAGSVWQSPEHNVRSNPSEAAAGIALGGEIVNGYLCVNRCHMSRYGGIQMSRALGDKDLSSVLNRVPELFTIAIEPNGWILLATDGLLDCGHTTTNAATEMGQIVGRNPTFDAADLVEIASNKDQHDNASAILVRFSE